MESSCRKRPRKMLCMHWVWVNKVNIPNSRGPNDNKWNFFPPFPSDIFAEDTWSIPSPMALVSIMSLIVEPISLLPRVCLGVRCWGLTVLMNPSLGRLTELLFFYYDWTCLWLREEISRRRLPLVEMAALSHEPRVLLEFVPVPFLCLNHRPWCLGYRL